MYHSYNAYRFESQVDKALKSVKSVLDKTRNPQLPSNVHHSYDDKYALSEYGVRGTVASFLNALEVCCGLSAENLATLKE